MEYWKNFNKGNWVNKINVRDFILKNIKPYYGNEDFLVKPSKNVVDLWEKVKVLLEKERNNGGVLSVDTGVVSSITSHKSGYIDQKLEKIVGLQTDMPLKRSIMPFGGYRMVKNGLKAYGFKSDDKFDEIFPKIRKTHNDAVFDIYNEESLKCRKSHIITGLPDAYGRGRIIGDYRRVALYGVDRLIEDKKNQKSSLDDNFLSDDVFREKEEIAEQIKSLYELIELGKIYGFDISKPAKNAQEAIQWIYFAYLAATKEANGAAMSLGRVSSFIDIYIERDIENNILTEEEAQELIDNFVIKLRLIRFFRTPEYDQLFSGDPTWVTESIAGMSLNGDPLVTKNSFRFLHTLTNLGPAPEPNMTILWSNRLPENFKKYCADMSIKTSSIQYENDDLMRQYYGDDYGIACCVSAMKIGKQMQFFGARANLAKTLLYAINGGKDEISGSQVGPDINTITDEYLDYEKVKNNFLIMMDWLAKVYINTLNSIHYMHDKYMYERIEMALHDKEIVRTMACGIAGLSVVADSLSAIKYAKVKVVRNEKGLSEDFIIEGNYPSFGNNDDKVDDIAVWIVESFIKSLKKQRTYRNSIVTLSILTITSNVVYGKNTGTTPDGRKYGQPFAPGVNPMHGRDKNGAIASMLSVAKIPYESAQDGISYTFNILPHSLGINEKDKSNNLVNLLDGYFLNNGHHINVNVFNKETLIDAMEHPEKYPQLTIRVSGYAVNFIKLTREQQIDVISRTFHEL